jgi:hypothetical protein
VCIYKYSNLLLIFRLIVGVREEEEKEKGEEEKEVEGGKGRRKKEGEKGREEGEGWCTL